MKERVARWLRAKGRSADEGMTLIELLAVIVILGIIVAVAVPVVLNSINNSRINTTKQSMSVLVEALNRYAAENNGNYPSSLNALVGSYIQAIPNDAWGQSFNYSVSGNSFNLTDPGHNITWNSSMTAPSGP